MGPGAQAANPCTASLAYVSNVKAIIVRREWGP
jgi:hypothetical protein